MFNPPARASGSAALRPPCCRAGDLVSLAPAAELVIHAAAIALRIDHAIYDCLYLACAEVEEAPLVTADRRLRDAARNRADPEVRLISDSETGRRIASAATGLVIRETTVHDLIDDPHYEAGLGRYWQAGLDRLRGKTPDIA